VRSGRSGWRLNSLSTAPRKVGSTARHGASLLPDGSTEESFQRHRNTAQPSTYITSTRILQGMDGTHCICLCVCISKGTMKDSSSKSYAFSTCMHPQPCSDNEVNVVSLQCPAYQTSPITPRRPASPRRTSYRLPMTSWPHSQTSNMLSTCLHRSTPCQPPATWTMASGMDQPM